MWECGNVTYSVGMYDINNNNVSTWYTITYYRYKQSRYIVVYRHCSRSEHPGHTSLGKRVPTVCPTAVYFLPSSDRQSDGRRLSLRGSSFPNLHAARPVYVGPLDSSEAPCS